MRDLNDCIHSTVPKGVKHDTGKPPLGLIMNLGPALVSIARVMEHGRKKYPNARNFQLVENAEERYINAALRHILDHCTGKTVDEESRLPTLAHAACDVAFALWHHLCIKPVEKCHT